MAPRQYDEYPDQEPREDPLYNPTGENWIPGQRSGLGIQVDSLRDMNYHLGEAERLLRIGSNALGVAIAVRRPPFG